MLAPEIVPLPLYRARHRGDPRVCRVCDVAETAHTDHHARPFYDRPDRPMRVTELIVRGTHKAPTGTLVGP